MNARLDEVHARGLRIRRASKLGANRVDFSSARAHCWVALLRPNAEGSTADEIRIGSLNAVGRHLNEIFTKPCTNRVFDQCQSDSLALLDVDCDQAKLAKK